MDGTLSASDAIALRDGQPPVAALDFLRERARHLAPHRTSAKTRRQHAPRRLRDPQQLPPEPCRHELRQDRGNTPERQGRPGNCRERRRPDGRHAHRGHQAIPPLRRLHRRSGGRIRRFAAGTEPTRRNRRHGPRQHTSRKARSPHRHPRPGPAPALPRRPRTHLRIPVCRQRNQVQGRRRHPEGRFHRINRAPQLAPGGP